MVENETLYLLFNLCESKNKFIFEVSDYFGDCLTVEELEYWMVYNVIDKAKFFNIDYTARDFYELVDEINKKNKELKNPNYDNKRTFK